MYFLCAGATVGGRVAVAGLDANSIQGDLRFVEILKEMGCEVTVDDDRVTLTRDPTRPLPP